MKSSFYQKGGGIIALILPLTWIMLMLVVGPMRARGTARDARRQSDLRQISLAMEMFYDDGDKYLQSKSMPTAIGNYLRPAPEDPGSGPCLSYQWIPNLNDPEKYCAWACLESGEYFIAGAKGTKMLSKAPTSLDCYEQNKLIYKAKLGDIRFEMKEAKNRGNILKGSEKTSGEKEGDSTTTEKFVEITISVENTGKENVNTGDWKVNYLVDSEGRKFYSPQQLNQWVPKESQCGTLLKPGSSPILCTKIYEVAKISTGLKVEVNYKNKESVFLNLGI